MKTGNPLYDWFGLNQALFLQLNGIHAPFLDALMRSLTSLGHPAFFPIYLAMAALVAWRRPDALPQRNVTTLVLSFPLVSMWIVPGLKALLNFPRPAEVFGAHANVILDNAEMHHSFPSGHAAFAVLLATSLMPGLAVGWRWALAGFAFLICLSRVVVGAHFPADVLAGAAIAWGVARALRALLNAFKPHPASPCQGRCGPPT